MTRVFQRATSIVAALLVFTGCGTLTVQQERELGQRVQRQVRQDMTFFRDPVTVRYIREMGQELVSNAAPSPFQIRFYVIEDESLNAFAVPGGAIYMHTGLIQAVDSPSELAGVLAHEIGHVTARHVAENYRRQDTTGIIAQLLSFAIAVLTGSSAAAQGGAVLTGMAAQAYLAPFGQDAERESDALAIGTMIRSDWDPNGLWTMFEKLRAEYGDAGLQFLSTHPAKAERIQNARDSIAALDLSEGLRVDDGGRLPIIQQRIEMLIGTDIEDFIDDEGTGDQ